jgi:hypothetical protein
VIFQFIIGPSKNFTKKEGQMSNPIVNALGKDVAGIIYRYVHQDLLSDVIREYKDLIMPSESFSGGVRFRLCDGRSFVFGFRYNKSIALSSNWKRWLTHAKSNTAYPKEYIFDVPSNYWEIKELY